MESHHPHKFWNTQPVVQSGEKPTFTGIIDNDRHVNANFASHKPLPLPSGFEWSVIDTSDPVQRKELFEFLRDNYATHAENDFRYAYPEEFLEWAFHSPGYIPEWIVSVRFGPKKKIVGFIAGTPITIHINDEIHKIAAVDFLSVHHRLRGRNLAPVLIKEIIRRLAVINVFEAIYTAAEGIAQPYTLATYYHRMINIEKLVEINFTQIDRGETLESMKQKYYVPKINLPGFRKMEEKDVPEVTVKLNEYQKQFIVGTVFTEEEVRYMLLPKKGILESFVVEDETTHEITAFFSLLLLPNSVLNNTKYKEFLGADFYYYFVKPSELLNVASAVIYAAAELGVDVITCMDIAENGKIISQLNFVQGDATQDHYIFNYAIDQFPPEKNGVSLL